LIRLNQDINDILESIQDNFYVINRDWDYVYVGKKAASALGMDPKDFIGKNLWKMFPKYEEQLTVKTSVIQWKKER
jgi:PAS domain S-box-containing protein